jgi:uncharacterized membrane protein
MNRLKSPVAWGALFVLVGFILKNYGLLEPLGLTPDSYKELTALITATMVSYGIWNNPTTKDSF